MVEKNFGKAVRLIREKRGMTQRQLAERVGSVPSHICKIETGYSYPSMDILKKIADALNVKLDDIAPDFELNEFEKYIPYLRKAEDWQIKAVETILKIKR